MSLLRKHGAKKKPAKYSDPKWCSACKRDKPWKEYVVEDGRGSVRFFHTCEPCRELSIKKHKLKRLNPDELMGKNRHFLHLLRRPMNDIAEREL